MILHLDIQNNAPTLLQSFQPYYPQANTNWSFIVSQDTFHDADDYNNLIYLLHTDQPLSISNNIISGFFLSATINQ